MSNDTSREHPGTGTPMTAIEYPADGTWSPLLSNDFHLTCARCPECREHRHGGDCPAGRPGGTR